MVIMHHLKLPAFRCWAKRAFFANTSSMPLQLSSQQLRFKADCKHLEPKCGDRFKRGPCITAQNDIKLEQPGPPVLPVQERFIRLKRSSKCCGSPCADALPRFDLLYYKRTNKFEREYQQTWDECPELLKKPKVVCCFDKIKSAKFSKRPRQERPLTACHQTCAATQAKCPYLTSKGCRPARHPPKCVRIRKEAQCRKLRAPSLAFSECVRKKPTIKPIECRCLLMPSICEVWSHYHYLEKIKKLRLC